MEIVDIFPGAVQTRMTRNRDNYETLMSADEVAEEVVSLLDKRGKTFYNSEVVLRKRNESSGS